jgi:maleylpyruvate isomerase
MSDASGAAEAPLPHDLLVEADQRLVRTVDGFGPDDFPAPSLLPGWSRGHVVAHLALNGEGLQAALDGLASGEPRPMYASPEARDAEIAELAAAEPSELRARLLASTSVFEQAVRDLPEDQWRSRIERTPGGPTFAAHATVLMRLREVEIHHVDLGAGYTYADWEPAFAALLIDSMTGRPFPAPFRVLARDLARTWEFGEAGGADDGPSISGDSRDLGWWLTGRGDGGSLTSDRDALPEVPAW